MASWAYPQDADLCWGRMGKQPRRCSLHHVLLDFVGRRGGHVGLYSCRSWFAIVGNGAPRGSCTYTGVPTPPVTTWLHL
jgi:hypothetical protein